MTFAATSRETPAVSATGRPALVRRRRRGGGWVTLLAILLVIGAILAVGDRVAASAANREVRSRLVAELDRRDVGYQTLNVDIGGFPFLVEVAQGRYDKVTIDMSDVTLPAKQLTGGRVATVDLPSLNVIAHNVTASTSELIKGTAKVNAGSVEGTAVVSYTTLQSLVDFSAYHLTDVTFGSSNGALSASGKVNFAGITVPISAEADISVVNGAFSIQLVKVDAAAIPAPPAVKDYLGGLAERTVSAKLPVLPFGLALQDVDPRPDGLAITAAGHDVPLVSTNAAS
jgi:LmeA-like phospholipid-binding